MSVSETSGKNEYIKAHALAVREKKELESRGLSPYPAVLDEVFPDAAHASGVELPTAEIPADRIIGTVSRGRISAFSASFLPLPEAESEFGMKWIALCDAHLSDTGIRDPIECVEYLGEFYVAEGNKRVSVLRCFGAVRIPAKVKRVLPQRSDDPRIIAYYEFLDFYKATGIYDIQFRKPGEYARLLSALGRKADDEWTDREIKRLVSAFIRFKEAFGTLDANERARQAGSPLRAEDALLLFLKVYSYEELTEMSAPEIKKALSSLWSDVKSAAEPDSIAVRTVPNEGEKKSVIQKLLPAKPKQISAAFICRRDAERSTWTRGHAEGAAYLSSALSGSVSVKTYFNADSAEEAERIIDEAVENGAELVFTTTPPLLDVTLKAAVKYPKVSFYNCSACQPLSSVKSYYCRTYEGKFITGVIAGALADNDLVGYVGSYPIMGVPASINAFALGVSMTNPRAKILLEWSCMEHDCVKKLREKGVKVISNRDIPIPDANYMKHGYYGTFLFGGDGEPSPIASPVWVWGRMYENIVRSILAGGAEKKEQAVNYWWGMDSGVIDVTVSELVPEGVRALAGLLTERLKKGEFAVFAHKLRAQDGTMISSGEALSSLDILKMDRLAESVIGRIPEYDELLPMSRPLVRELGLHRDRLPPED